jgi:hypothetical protein
VGTTLLLWTAAQPALPLLKPEESISRAAVEGAIASAYGLIDSTVLQEFRQLSSLCLLILSADRRRILALSYEKRSQAKLNVVIRDDEYSIDGAALEPAA